MAVELAFIDFHEDNADFDFVGQVQRIDEAIHANTSLAGKLIRVNRPLR